MANNNSNEDTNRLKNEIGAYAEDISHLSKYTNRCLFKRGA